jgi:hypothetical protein
MAEVDSVLKERGSRYGAFVHQATTSQELQDVIKYYMGFAWAKMQPDQREAIQMICMKLSRIANGDPDYPDSWLDIAGYAKLVADRLEGKVQ